MADLAVHIGHDGDGRLGAVQTGERCFSVDPPERSAGYLSRQE